MARLCVPKIGDTLTLIEGWNFLLHYERRNRSLAEKMGLSPPGSEDKYWGWRNAQSATLVLLPADTELKVDRVYIRGGASVEFNSLTFRVKNGPYKGCRFWAKLADVNKMEVMFN